MLKTLIIILVLININTLDSPVAEEYEAMFLSQATTDIDKSRLKAAS